MTQPATQAASARLRAYAGLLALQTIGMACILWQGLPIYRRILDDPSKHAPSTGPLIWVLAATTLSQAAYWIGLRRQPAPPRRARLFVGHIFQFLARLSFTFGGAMFGLMFFVRPEGLTYWAPGIAALLLGLFALFCYSLELDRLGKLLNGPDEKNNSR